MNTDRDWNAAARQVCKSSNGWSGCTCERADKGHACESMQNALRLILDRVGISPEHVGKIEAGGTATVRKKRRPKTGGGEGG